MQSRTKRISGQRENNTTLFLLVCSPERGGVLASVVLVFKFTSSDSKATSWGHVNRVLRRRLQTSSTFLDVDQSTIRLTGKCLRFVFLAWNLFLILYCSQCNEFHFTMQIQAILVFFFCLLKIVLQLTAWELEKGGMRRTKALSALIYECELPSVHQRLSLCDLALLNEIVCPPPKSSKKAQLYDHGFTD